MRISRQSPKIYFLAKFPRLVDWVFKVDPMVVCCREHGDPLSRSDASRRLPGPLLDMKRYNHLLAGASWMAEYGNPDKPEEWSFIQKFSPYHNVRRTRSIRASCSPPRREMTGFIQACSKDDGQDGIVWARCALLREHRGWAWWGCQQSASCPHAGAGLFVPEEEAV